jgi:hypothetical protein
MQAQVSSDRDSSSWDGPTRLTGLIDWLADERHSSVRRTAGKSSTWPQMGEKIVGTTISNTKSLSSVVFGAPNIRPL